MKKFLLMALWFGLPMGIMMGAFFGWQNNSWQSGLFTGAVMGLFSGATFSGVMIYAQKKLMKSIHIQLEPGETVLLEAGANHFMGSEAVGGKLALLPTRLAFQSHGLNIQNHALSFNLNEISDIEVGRVLLIQKGLFFKHLGVKHKFVVDEPKNWMALILESKKG